MNILWTPVVLVCISTMLSNAMCASALGYCGALCTAVVLSPVQLCLHALRSCLSLHLREALAQLLDAGKKVVDSPVHLADFGAALTSAASSQLQEVMACMDVSGRQLDVPLPAFCN